MKRLSAQKKNRPILFSYPVVELTAEEVLRLVVMPDEQGRYHFDEMGIEHLPECLGYLVGSPSRSPCL